ncbi:MAG: PCP reductase family protein [Myxococcota bacterium]|nr:PCP reductase family protein [Myxococcota bacterium]
MKFLCVSCDEPMKLIDTQPPERGSLTVLYRCSTCSHEIAMLTNPYETQVVGSLGVEIGADGESTGESKCPFSGVVRDLETPLGESNGGVSWTTEASSRLESIPEFARPMARTGIEKFAAERGLARIDAQVLEQAREFFGM